LSSILYRISRLLENIKRSYLTNSLLAEDSVLLLPIINDHIFRKRV
jgi:hypothetical protein